jgi:hypothetical protein
VFALLPSRQQNGLLLHAIIPRAIVAELSKGQGYAKNGDCCVIFAVGAGRVVACYVYCALV